MTTKKTGATDANDANDQLLLNDHELRLLFESECDVAGVPEDRWEDLWVQFREKHLRSVSKNWAHRFRDYVGKHGHLAEGGAR